MNVLHRMQRCAVFALMAILLCGCSTFNRDWRRAESKPVTADSVEGRWEGTWLSDSNGHNGKLRCLMTRVDDSKYEARFRATYAKILRFSYTVPLEMQPHDNGWEFNGEANLGKLAGGVYFYEGRVSPTNLFSTYRCKYDHGVFQLQRPK